MQEIGVRIYYKSHGENEYSFPNIEELLSFFDFSHDSQLKQFSGDMGEEAEVNEIEFSTSPAAIRRIIADLGKVGYDYTEVETRGATVIQLSNYQVKLKYK